MSSISILLEQEVDSLLLLLSANLKTNITAEEGAAQGFLTFCYTKQEIKGMMKEMPQPVVKNGERIEAYALACTKQVCLGHSLLLPMVRLSESLQWRGQELSGLRYYVMGQICVGASLRGQGAFDALYEAHRSLFSEQYDCVMTEIAEDNLRSMAAHKRVGFHVVHQYFDGETNWNMVLWDWNK